MSRNLSTRKTQLQKLLGQSFLKDQNQVRKIVDSAQIGKKETILEIGGGEGSITLELVKKAKKVVCIEKDSILAHGLKDLNIKNLEVIEADVLQLFKNNKLDIKGLKEYKVVANIPYYLTSILIRNLLEADNKPNDIFLMIQKEVAERICSKPPHMSILSVSVQYYADPKTLFKVSKGCSSPQPKVDSALIQITPKGIKKNDSFFKVVKAGFSHPRKQLINNLSNGLRISREEASSCLKKIGIEPEQRAETLSLDDWVNLHNALVNHGKNSK
ncbi:MAG: 16S rRNA (adenine(1518)-N(6)/adenine(1519)-N(6))-dimethyltransferase RsmA [Candidatus Pacebacteria bacterium]|nr:16S rRNA (adenine(1518)-N(6)/adenine(1519)-N(6))-dimethyltransferase RsmA [Candidatus Paceibacterota bacterium]